MTRLHAERQPFCRRIAPPLTAGRKWISLFSLTGSSRPSRATCVSTATAIPGRNPAASHRRDLIPGNCRSSSSMIWPMVAPGTVTVSFPPVRFRISDGIHTTGTISPAASSDCQMDSLADWVLRARNDKSQPIHRFAFREQLREENSQLPQFRFEFPSNHFFAAIALTTRPGDMGNSCMRTPTAR